MTPAEHYTEAERLLAVAKGADGPVKRAEDVANLVAGAQAHAQLAAVGALFLNGQGAVYPDAHDALVDAIYPTPEGNQ